MQNTFIILGLFLCGCGVSHHQSQSSAIHQHTIFDSALAEPKYAYAITQAQLDLPNDTWSESPYRENDTRRRREYQVATNILADIEPKLKQLTVTELVRSLKIESAPGIEVTAKDFSGVAEYVYLCGYDMIEKEIQSRPKKELKVLPSLADGSVWLFTGMQGPAVTLEIFVHELDSR